MLSRSLGISASLGFLMLAIPAQHCNAQLTVQQPVFGVNSVSTTVSVPDRGRAHLGSISRTRDSRTTFGPFRSGSSIGLDREHTGMSVGVYIHDFEAMDRHLLSQGTPASVSSNPRLTGRTRHAWNQLQQQHGGRPSSQTPASPKLAKSEKYWRLGQKAEQDGKRSVARLHYRIASKYGSKAAKARLAEWNSANAAAEIADRDR